MRKSPLLILGLLFLNGCSTEIASERTVKIDVKTDLVKTINLIESSGKFYSKTTGVQVSLSDESYVSYNFTPGTSCDTNISFSSIPAERTVSLTLASTEVAQPYSFLLKKGDSTLSECHTLHFVVDSAAPAQGALSIIPDTLKNMTEYLGTTLANLSFTAVDALPIEVFVSSNNSCSTGSWQPFSLISTFSLTGTHDSTHKVYAKFRDALENETGCLESNQVTLDLQGPGVTDQSLLVSGLPKADPVLIHTPVVNLSLAAQDPLLAKMKITNNADCSGGTYEAFATIKSGWDLGSAEGSKVVSVKFKDTLGHESACQALNINYASGGPTGSISIAGAIDFQNKTFVSSSPVQVNITAQNSTKMTFYSDAECSIALSVEEPLAATKNLNIGALEGEKTIAVQFKNDSAMTSNCISLPFILDTAGPQNLDVVPLAEFFSTSEAYTKSNSITFQIAAQDLSLKDYEWKAGNSCGDGSSKMPFADSFVANINGADQAYIFAVQAFDIFNRPSACKVVSVVKDTTAGNAPVFLNKDLPTTAGSLNETPRIYLNESSEVQDASSKSGVAYYAGKLTDSGNQEIMPWTNLGNHESFVISGLGADVASGKTLHSGLTLVEGETYTFHLRSHDNLGHISPDAQKTFVAKPRPVILTSQENATPNSLVISDYKATGVGSGTPLTLINATACKAPCDVGAQGASTLTLEEGANYKIGLTTSASGTVKASLVVGNDVATRSTSSWYASTGLLCDTNYLFIPEDKNTNMHAFCLAKYEMKEGALSDPGNPSSPKYAESKPEGLIYTGVDRVDSQLACSISGKRLITNDEWNSVARNIAQVDSNWQKDGDGNRLALNRGISNGSVQDAITNLNDHCEGTSDSPCAESDWKLYKRTHKLSTGAHVWDLAGNTWELVNDSIDYSFSVGNKYIFDLPESGFFNFILGSPSAFTCFEPYNNGYCNMGYSWISNTAVGKALYRGGTKHSGNNAGIFTADYDEWPTNKTNYHSFRCVHDIVEN